MIFPKYHPAFFLKQQVKDRSEISFSKNSHQIEISQLISKTTQLTGFYMIRVFTERCSRTDFSSVTATKLI